MAFGSSTINDFGGAVSDILGGQAKAAGMKIDATGMRLKASGDLTEAQDYDLASTLARQNAQFTETSTAVKEMQTQRQIYQGLGTTQADVAGAGFSMSGSGLDIMRMGAQEGALTKAVAGEQGLITEAGFTEQAEAYTNMAGAARYASGVENDMAGQEDDLASQTERNGYITGGIKAAAGIASLFI